MSRCGEFRLGCRCGSGGDSGSLLGGLAHLEDLDYLARLLSDDAKRVLAGRKAGENIVYLKTELCLLERRQAFEQIGGLLSALQDQSEAAGSAAVQAAAEYAVTDAALQAASARVDVLTAQTAQAASISAMTSNMLRRFMRRGGTGLPE